MNDHAPPPASGPLPAPLEEAVSTFIKTVVKMVRLFKLYPPHHPFVQESLEEAVSSYTAAIEMAPDLTIGHAKGKILVGGRPLSQQPQQVAEFSSIMARKDIDTIALETGAHPEEIISFARLLGLRDGAEIPKDLKFKKFDSLFHISVTSVSAQPPVVETEEGEEDRTSPDGTREIPPPDADPPAEATVRRVASGSCSPQDVRALLAMPPPELGRAIQSVSSRLVDSGAGGTPLVLKLLEAVATTTLSEGGGLGDVLNTTISIVDGMPGNFVRTLTSGAAPSEAPAILLRKFKPALRARLFTATLHNDPPMAALERNLDMLVETPRERLALFETASITLREEGKLFEEAYPLLLDLLELDRRARQRELAKAAEQTAMTTAVPPKGKPKVLVAEEAPIYQQFFKGMLDEDIYQVDLVADGKEAFDAILHDRPDLVILDMKLPRMHGADIVRRLRQGDFQPPLLIITDHRALAQDFDVKTYPHQITLKKPPARDAVAKALDTLLQAPAAAPLPASDDDPADQGITTGQATLLQEGSLRDPVKIAGFDVGFHVHSAPGQEAVLLDRFLLSSDRIGFLLTGRSEADADAILLLGLFQTSVRLVGPWHLTGKGTLVQAAALLGNDRIAELPLVAQTLVYEPTQQDLRICTAGAPTPLKFLTKLRKLRKVGSVGVALGSLIRGGMGRVLEEARLPLDPADTMVLSSWGVLRATNEKGNLFGVESVGGLILTATNSSPGAVARRIGDGVGRHVQPRKPESFLVMAVRRS